MNYDIPGLKEPLELRTIILDLNGTLSVGGTIVSGATERIGTLKEAGFNLVLFTGNTRNDADSLANNLGIEWRLARNGDEKRDLALEMQPEHCASIGNGLIDAKLMEVVRLRIVTLQAEGVHVQTLLHSDILVPSILDALDLLIDKDRLIATLRP